MKPILFIQSKAPHSAINGQEGLDAVLMGTAFAACTLLFVGDGIFQLMKDQSPETLGLKNYSLSYGVLEDYGVQRIVCASEDLSERGLTTDDLVIPVEVLEASHVRELLTTHSVVLGF